jgi:hypothetical protein
MNKIPHVLVTLFLALLMAISGWHTVLYFVDGGLRGSWISSVLVALALALFWITCALGIREIWRKR